MHQNEAYVTGILLVRFRGVPSGKVRAFLSGGARKTTAAAEALAKDTGIAVEEAHGFLEAARFLVSGDLLRACAQCQSQSFGAAAATAPCARCGKPMQAGVLSFPQSVAFATGLELHVRRLILDATAKARTKKNVAQAQAMHATGEIGKRPEGEIAPREKGCHEQALGHYTLKKLIGRGSASYVYLAEDRRDGSAAALKVLYLPEGESKEKSRERVARFQREAELASVLDHPNLVPVRPLEQVGSWSFIPMGYVDGPTLAHLLEAKRRPGEGEAAPLDRRALALALAEVARGLHYAHCRGVVHRDVSPRNILFSSTGHAYLSDFGAAKPLTGDSQLTSAHSVVGTWAYASPERLDSEAKADARSDVYSLGVVLFEILTGRLPFPETELGKLLPRMIKESPPPPRTLNATVTQAQDAVVRRALERDPTKRFPSALDFAQAVSAAFVEDEVPGATEATASWAAGTGAGAGGGSRRMAAALGALATLVAALALLNLDRRPDPAALLGSVDGAIVRMAASRTPGEHETALGEAERALVAAENVLGSAAVRPARARLLLAQGLARDCVTRLGEGGGALPAGARMTRGMAALWLTQRHGTAPGAKEWRDLARADFGALRREGPTPWLRSFGEAALLLLGGDLESAYPRFHQLARENPDRPEAPVLEAWIAIVGGNAESANAALPGVHQRFPMDPWVNLVRALGLEAAGRHDEALTVTHVMTKAWPAMLEASLTRGLVFLRTDRAAEAVAAANVALALDPTAPGVHRLRADALAAAGDFCAAIGELTQAMALEPDLDESLWRRALLYYAHEVPERGRKDLQEYVERFPQGEFVGEARARLGGK